MTTTSSSPAAFVHPTLLAVSARIRQRSQDTRAAYEAMLRRQSSAPSRRGLGCANAAHVMAAMPEDDRLRIREERQPHLGIVTAYNDMLSAHQPYEHYPTLMREAARAAQATAQVAGGVPAMCDGITQGESGMELSLFSRDVIALATAVALTHGVFDAALCLGVCDKIVPGLFIGALQFGHLPLVMVPAGPMTSGISNAEKAKVRQAYAQGQVDRQTLLASEQAAYHGAGTCTFYGTANSNQLLMDVMGLHLPGAAFVPPHGPLRQALTGLAVQQAAELARRRRPHAASPGQAANPSESGRWAADAQEAVGCGWQVSAEVMVNGMVALLATGGSTNHTLHLLAMGRAAGWIVEWEDFAELATCVPLLARVYPNGQADVNQFHLAGGTPWLMRELLDHGLLHEDVQTILGRGLRAHARMPEWQDAQVVWREPPQASGDEQVLRGVARPFAAEGGLRVLQGNLGKAIIKTSAVDPRHWRVRAPARVFDDQQAFERAFAAGELTQDMVVVLRGQGPKANGMPELHRLTPLLGVMQDRGLAVALVTDGRMSGASGKVPSAIHVCPEAVEGGAIALVRDGDMLSLDCEHSRLQLEVDPTSLAARSAWRPPVADAPLDQGRGIFELFRQHVSSASLGASVLWPQPPQR